MTKLRNLVSTMIEFELNFPLFRKLSNGKSFYKIISKTSFEEIQLIGSKSFKRKIQATQFPEMILIQDIIQLVDPYQLSSEQEFTQFESQSI
ncbi:MAG: hypothetical protein K9G36_02585 [Crocinitomicaceae bacterium]|nr:hypothetical protein [Crocinitomicaceae bacterium]MCF8410257.1 hypothetical protein [Crocinitomicaceae bacterium]MCF8444774.1 hypothetical protein [Crocinitomicaceae bacterium]